MSGLLGHQVADHPPAEKFPEGHARRLALARRRHAALLGPRGHRGVQAPGHALTAERRVHVEADPVHGPRVGTEPNLDVGGGPEAARMPPDERDPDALVRVPERPERPVPEAAAFGARMREVGQRDPAGRGRWRRGSLGRRHAASSWPRRSIQPWVMTYWTSAAPLALCRVRICAEVLVSTVLTALG